MCTVVAKTVQESLQAALLHSSLICRRGVSTNSAIAQGIRKSRAGATREPYGSSREPYGSSREQYGSSREQYGSSREQYSSSRGAPREAAFAKDRSSARDRNDRYQSGRASFDTGRKEKYAYPQDRSDSRGFGRENKEQYTPSRDSLGDGRNGRDRDEGKSKPWHQGGREEQRNAFRDERRAPRQESYPQKGSRGDNPMRRSSPFDTSERSTQRRYDSQPEDTYRPPMTQGAQSRNVWHSSSGNVAFLNNGNTASTPQNRAERRAAQFGEAPVGGANNAYHDRKSPERRSSVFSRASDPERFEERQKARAAKREYKEPSPVRDDFKPTDFAPRDSKPDRFEERRESLTPRNNREEELGDEFEDNAPRFDPEHARPRKRDTPLSIPYTTPASEFLYGTSVVIAALKSPSRKLYKLYMYDGEHRDAKNMDGTVRKLALAREVEIFKVKSDWLPLMDKMSAGRPHNGYILEASPLPKLPATGLLPVDGYNRPLEVSLDHQSREDELVNGTNPVIKYKTAFPRYPFVLMLDGIVSSLSPLHLRPSSPSPPPFRSPLSTQLTPHSSTPVTSAPSSAPPTSSPSTPSPSPPGTPRP